MSLIVQDPFAGYPEVSQIDGKWILRTFCASASYVSKELAEEALDGWLQLKYESERPARSWVNELADALQEAFDSQ
jgi:hypothetical protein